MLRIYRRHEKRCALTSKADPNCPGKLKCPVWITGTLQDGSVVKPKSLNTRNWSVAAQRALEMEAGFKPPEPKITVAQAVASYREFKDKRSPDTKRKIKLLTDRLQTFLEKRSIFNIADVKLPHLAAFRETWTGADTTRRRDQEILKSFFWYCDHSDFLTKNPVVHLDPISVMRAKTEPFTHEDQVAIFNTLPDFPDEHGRRGTPIALQTKAFVYILRYTGMAIGDVAKLEKADVQGCRIRTYRKKTAKMSSPKFRSSLLMRSMPRYTIARNIFSGLAKDSSIRERVSGATAYESYSNSLKSTGPVICSATRLREIFWKTGEAWLNLPSYLAIRHASANAIILSGISAGKIDLNEISISCARTIRSRRC